MAGPTPATATPSSAPAPSSAPVGAGTAPHPPGPGHASAAGVPGVPVTAAPVAPVAESTVLRTEQPGKPTSANEPAASRVDALGATVTTATPATENARATVRTSAPMTDPALTAAQLAPRIMGLRRLADGTHHLTITVHPQEIGTVRISVELQAGTISLALLGSDETARALLRDALPALRRELSDAGLTLGSTDAPDPGTSGFGGHGRTQQGDVDAGPDWRRAPAPQPRDAPATPVRHPRAAPAHAGAVDLSL